MELSQTYQIHICDDIKEHALELKNLLQSLDPSRHVEITVSSSAKEFLALLSSVENGETPPWNILFMDICLPESDGITLGKKIRELCPDTYLILVSSHSEYAIKGYEAAAYRYLLKPVKKEDLLTLMADIQADYDKKRKLLIKGRKNSAYVALNDILYISAEDKYAIVYTPNGHFICDISLNKYEEQLKDYGFYRIHRKYLVNVYHHRSLNNNHACLSDGTTLPVSKSKTGAYRNFIFSYMREELI
ncbi:MAG: response regulator transcription factor [Lachnospiraceae bacterium]|nr:response regulator transcription factor [Lachnospiraceae bacterium]